MKDFALQNPFLVFVMILFVLNVIDNAMVGWINSRKRRCSQS